MGRTSMMLWSVLKSFIGFTRNFETVAQAKADKFLRVGQKISIAERDDAVFDVVKLADVTGDEYSIYNAIPHDKGVLYFKLRHNELTTIDSYGAIGIVDESAIFQAYANWATAQVGITTMRLGRNKKYMCTNVIITSNTRLDLSGCTVYQVPNSTTAVFRNKSKTDAHFEDNVHVVNGILNGSADRYAQDTQNFLLRFVSLHNFSVVGVVFENMSSKNAIGGTCIALLVSGTSKYYWIDKCSFFRIGTKAAPGNGIFAQGSYGVISNCIADEVYDTAFNFERMTHGVMSNNTATNTGHGFAVTLECENIAISNNTSIGAIANNYLVNRFTHAGGTLMKNIVLSNNVGKVAGTEGVGNNFFIQDADGVSLSNNIGDTSNDANFELQGCKHVVIDGGNATNSTTKYGIFAQNCIDVKVSDMNIYEQFAYGMFYWDCSEVVVNGNKIHHTKEHQIRIKGGAHITVESNEIYDQLTVGQRALITDGGVNHLTVKGNNIFDTREVPTQRGCEFDATATNVYYKGNVLHNLVAGNYLTDNAVNTKGYTRRGVTALRPTGLGSGDDVGQRYLDTTLAPNGKPIEWTGSEWVDALGNAA